MQGQALIIKYFLIGIDAVPSVTKLAMPHKGQDGRKGRGRDNDTMLSF